MTPTSAWNGVRGGQGLPLNLPRVYPSRRGGGKVRGEGRQSDHNNEAVTSVVECTHQSKFKKYHNIILRISWHWNSSQIYCTTSSASLPILGIKVFLYLCSCPRQCLHKRPPPNTSTPPIFLFVFIIPDIGPGLLPLLLLSTQCVRDEGWDI